MNATYIETPSGMLLETRHPEAWTEAKRIPAATAKARLKAEAIADLKKTLKPGDTVYCVLRDVSRSGMSRRIDFFTIKKGELCFLSGQIGHVLGLSRGDKGGLRVDGCGMDMGFHVVYNLGATLWPKGTRKPHGTRNGEPDSDGGYALKSRWV